MKRYLITILAVCSLFATYSCGEPDTGNDEGPVKTPAVSNTDAVTDQAAPATTPTNTDDSDTSSSTNEDHTDTNPDPPVIEEPVPPECPSDDTDFVGCKEKDGHDWLLICRDGEVSQSLECYENERCSKVGNELRCLEDVADDVADFCAMESHKTDAFCQYLGNDSWYIVCEDGQVVQNAFGTSNCTASGQECKTITDAWGTYNACAECSSDSECKGKNPPNSAASCLYGICTFSCNDGYSRTTEDTCEAEKIITSDSVAINFDFLNNTRVDEKAANSYETVYNYTGSNYKIVATGRTNLTNTINVGTENEQVVDYAIDGAGIIIRTAATASSQIEVTGLQKGIGSISFDAFSWDAGNISITLIGGTAAKYTSKQIKKSNRAVPGKTFNDPEATGFIITSMGRMVIDNLKWDIADLSASAN